MLDTNFSLVYILERDKKIQEQGKFKRISSTKSIKRRTSDLVIDFREKRFCAFRTHPWIVNGVSRVKKYGRNSQYSIVTLLCINEQKHQKAEIKYIYLISAFVICASSITLLRRRNASQSLLKSKQSRTLLGI